MKSKFAVAAFFSVLSLSSTHAADIATVYKTPPIASQVYSWSGFYLGGNVGYAWGNSGIVSSAACPNAPCPYTSTIDLSAIAANASGASSPAGFTGGGQVGYNWQSGSKILGLETDFNSFRLFKSLDSTATRPKGPSLQSFTSSTSVGSDWLFTLRGRLGWAITPSVLLYGTGGWAVTELQISNSYIDNCGHFCGPNYLGRSHETSTRNGWIVGAGIEWAIAGRWTAKAEYLYVDFGSIATTALIQNANSAFLGVTPNLLATSGDLRVNILRAGLNYRFDYGR